MERVAFQDCPPTSSSLSVQTPSTDSNLRFPNLFTSNAKVRSYAAARHAAQNAETNRPLKDQGKSLPGLGGRWMEKAEDQNRKIRLFSSTARARHRRRKVARNQLPETRDACCLLREHGQPDGGRPGCCHWLTWRPLPLWSLSLTLCAHDVSHRQSRRDCETAEVGIL